MNPLNDVFSATIAANDVLHLPSHVYAVGEEPRFPKILQHTKARVHSCSTYALRVYHY